MKSSEHAMQAARDYAGQETSNGHSGLKNECEDGDHDQQSDQENDSDRSTDKFEHADAPGVLRSSQGTNM